MGPAAETGARDGTPDTLGIVNVYTSVSTSEAAFTGWTGSAALGARCRMSGRLKYLSDSANGTNLGLALTALFARLGGALVFHGCGRSQEDAGAFGTGEGAVLVIVIIVPPRHIVRDQIPAVVELVLGGLGKGWADRGGDGVDRGDGGTARTADLSGVLVVWGEIKKGDGEVRSKL